MVARLRLGLCLVASFVLSCAQAQYDGYRYPYEIDKFAAYLTLEPDSTLKVTEILDVTFYESRHGIFRRIPFEFDTGRGIVRKTVLDQIRVVDASGNPYTKKVTREGAYIRIRIGDADIELPPGTQKTYAISYRVQNAVNWFGKDQAWDPYAELYWNVTGNDWDTVIRSCSFEVKFPDNRQPRVKVLTGYGGSTASNVAEGIGDVQPNTETQASLSVKSSFASGLRPTPLEPGEGLTLVLNVPAELVARPTPMAQAWWTVSSNPGFLIPFIVFAVLFPFWLKRGRDPVGKPCEVMFEPPDGMSATECGSLLDETVDLRDVSAGLVTLAVKGYLTIHPAGTLAHRPTSFVIRLTEKVPDKSLGTFETKLHSHLKSGGPELDKSDLTTYVGTNVSDLRALVFKGLVKRGYYLRSPIDTAAKGCFAGVALVALLVFLLNAVFSSGADVLSYWIGGIVSLILVGGYSKVIPRRTQKGADARNQVAGFEAAMRGRRPYMEWIADKKIAEVKYEEYLPYAIAFGLVQQWSDTFREVVTHAPAWYVSPYPYDGWTLSHFGADLDSVTTSAGYAASTPPKTSSSSGSSGFSSGGGFSGGGFGGGGGGSW